MLPNPPHDVLRSTHRWYAPVPVPVGSGCRRVDGNRWVSRSPVASPRSSRGSEGRSDVTADPPYNVCRPANDACLGSRTAGGRRRVRRPCRRPFTLNGGRRRRKEEGWGPVAGRTESPIAAFGEGDAPHGNYGRRPRHTGLQRPSGVRGGPFVSDPGLQFASPEGRGRRTRTHGDSTTTPRDSERPP